MHRNFGHPNIKLLDDYRDPIVGVRRKFNRRAPKRWVLELKDALVVATMVGVGLVLTASIGHGLWLAGAQLWRHWHG